MSVRRPLSLFGVMLLLVAGASTAQAQDAAPDVETQQLFAEGNTLLEARSYAAALAKYEAAFARYPHARILLNMGTALRGLGRNAQAADAYERYQRDPQADPARKAEAASAMEKLEPLIARLDVDVGTPGAQISVDGRVLETLPASVRLDPGDHVIVASKVGSQQAEQTVSLKATETKSIRLTLVSLAPEAEPLATSAVADAGSSTNAVHDEPVAVEPAGARDKSYGFALGLRAGYAVPFGLIDSGSAPGRDDMPVTFYTAGALPLVLDGELQLPHHFLVGALFQYAFTQKGNWCADSDCSGHSIRAGATLGYQLELGTRFDARAGIGGGYEWLGVNDRNTGEHKNWGGPELHLELGADMKFGDKFTLGPFGSYSLAQYWFGLDRGTTMSGGLEVPWQHSRRSHHWVLFGVRAGVALWP